MNEVCDRMTSRLLGENGKKEIILYNDDHDKSAVWLDTYNIVTNKKEK